MTNHSLTSTTSNADSVHVFHTVHTVDSLVSTWQPNNMDNMDAMAPRFPNTSEVTTGPSPTLNGLPTEILCMVFGHYVPHPWAKLKSDAPEPYLSQECQSLHWSKRRSSLNRKDLVSLCLTSKRLKAIAQPIIYRKFPLGFGHLNSSLTCRCLASFLRTMAERRDLAKLVNGIYIHPMLPVNNIDKKRAQEVLDQVARGEIIQLAEFMAHLPDLQHPSTPSRVIASALLSVLLTILPNLDHFGGEVGHVVTSVNVSIRRSAMRAAGLDRLQLETIDIFSKDQPTPCHRIIRPRPKRNPYAYAGKILNLAPGIKTLNLHRCNDSSWNFAMGSKLQTLRITQTEIGKDHFKALLSSCANLNTFVYEAVMPTEDTFRNFVYDFNDAVSHYLQPSDAVNKLAHLSGTLKSLHLDFRGWELRQVLGRATYDLISSLAQFVVLEELSISSNAIYLEERHKVNPSVPENEQRLAQVLPPNITTLRLCGVSQFTTPRLQEGLLYLTDSISRGEFPKLKQVRCYESVDKPSTSWKDWQLRRTSIKTRFSMVGVDFAYDSDLEISDAMALAGGPPFGESDSEGEGNYF
ncbi:hypothetical protein F4820DRAFT_437826 [Hypoxylon rubiginosum]|uniref:Uncharacterized protein n=1 Tax=Hypoxylon rubiginosum TaxID=110542 RepID=A0ACB9YLT2_9PEZI|nr:hypothetical protein F4820DRAFT_437826 [Hypoxylon rubiginosum]